MLVVFVGCHDSCYFSVFIDLRKFPPLVEYHLPLHPPLALRFTLIPVDYFQTVVNCILLYAPISPLFLLILLDLIAKDIVIIIFTLLSLP